MAQVQGTYCPPPERYKLFTQARLARVRRMTQEELEASGDLEVLCPPPPPTEGGYLSFGEPFQVHEQVPSLEAQGIPQVYTLPSASDLGSTQSREVQVAELKRIHRAIAFNFLELVTRMSQDPVDHEKKLEEIRLLFLNAHHLINSFRLPQAKETLLLMLQDRAARKREQAAQIHRRCDEIEKALASARNRLLQAAEQASTPSEKDGTVQELDFSPMEMEGSSLPEPILVPSPTPPPDQLGKPSSSDLHALASQRALDLINGML